MMMMAMMMVVAGAAPVVEEVGPYTFVEKSKKYGVTFSQGGNLVSYSTQYQYIYDGPIKQLDDVVSTVMMTCRLASFAGSRTSSSSSSSSSSRYEGEEWAVLFFPFFILTTISTPPPTITKTTTTTTTTTILLLQRQISTIDLPYLGVTATVGQESNILRVGSRQGTVITATATTSINTDSLCHPLCFPLYRWRSSSSSSSSGNSNSNSSTSSSSSSSRRRRSLIILVVGGGNTAA